MTVRCCVRVVRSICKNGREFRMVGNGSIGAMVQICTLIIVRCTQNPIVYDHPVR